MHTSKKKIVWNDIEFLAAPTDCMRAYAYHKRERCGARASIHIRGFATPGIRRYRTYVGRDKVVDTTVCDACQVPVGRSAFHRLEEQGQNVVRMDFGPPVKNIRTDYYQPLSEPFGEVC